MGKLNITIRMSGGQDDVTVTDNGVTKTFDRGAMNLSERNRLRRLLVKGWEAARNA